jgi:hypothetical protein
VGKSAVHERNGQRRLYVDFPPRHHTREYGRDQNVENRANQKRNDQPDGQVALGILCFLGRG